MFFHCGGKIINSDNIKYIVCNHFPQHGHIFIHYINHAASDIIIGEDAVKVMRQLYPDILEEMEVVLQTDSWALHNLIGHPLMQIFIWFHLPKWADWIHDKTMPKPKINDN